MASEFLSRWSKRKLQPTDTAEHEHEKDIEQVLEPSPHIQSEQIEQPSMPREESDNLDEESPQSELSVAQLLATGAAASVKKAALRKLFLSGEFSAVDNLNDYDLDYSSVDKLSIDVAQKLREWVNDVEQEPDPEPESDMDSETAPQQQDCDPTASTLQQSEQVTDEELDLAQGSETK
ncbi:DUF3306 domain-containing protein [Vibrio gallicus]|uniref:DUF3306 domain-containing protein n=1 Tax=Vibrio gallicus TaxID=190897 RepID=UPI0021C34F08|nr:DUF3306 domain-containing protein [Vibrio gallicus]